MTYDLEEVHSSVRRPISKIKFDRRKHTRPNQCLAQEKMSPEYFPVTATELTRILLSICTLAASGCVTAFVLLATAAAYRLFFHPLARIPGPKWAAVSSVWYAKKVRDGRTFELGRTLHDQYGPVVRVAPNEVWFNSKDAFKSIYRMLNQYHLVSLKWII